MKLLSVNADAKTVKGVKVGVLTGILYLAPSDESGVMNTCKHASKGCRSACLFTAGRGAFSNVKAARIAKTVRFVKDQTQFMLDLVDDIAALIKKATKENLIPAVRLNGTSDIRWEDVLLNGKNVMQIFPNVQFYDYTKDSSVLDWRKKLPANLHLTFSKSESNDSVIAKAVSMGMNVAVVFSGKTLPATYLGRPVINGDDSDVRFNDPNGVVVGLKAKGKAKRDTSGFVVAV
jgi:hypothetical protein